MKNIQTYDQFLLEGNSKGEYSYKEMRDFLDRIIPNLAPFVKSYRGPNVSIPTSRNSHDVVYNIENELLSIFDKSNSKWKSEKPKYYISDFSFKNSQLNSKVKMIGSHKVDLQSLYQSAVSNPGELETIRVNFNSKKQDQFGKDMSSGKYGSLD